MTRKQLFIIQFGLLALLIALAVPQPAFAGLRITTVFIDSDPLRQTRLPAEETFERSSTLPPENGSESSAGARIGTSPSSMAGPTLTVITVPLMELKR
jgi:hypothetical protein